MERSRSEEAEEGGRRHEKTIIITASGLRLSILELPAPIICDTLSRLPLKTILSCRCVCKTFRDLLVDPYFAKLYHLRSPQCLFIHQFFDYGKRSSPEFFVADLETGRGTVQFHDALIKLNNNLGLTKDKEGYFPSLLDYCNGLLCFDSGEHHAYYISNPILGEYYALPSPRRAYSCSVFHVCRFGFCPKTNQYKLIRVAHSYSAVVETEIHTIGTKSWRNIQNPPCHLDCKTVDTCLNGILHWFPHQYYERSRKTTMVQSFDIENERFGQIPTPADLNDRFYRGRSLGLLGGCLCIYTTYFSDYQVWVMSDYGVKESWTKKFAISWNNPSRYKLKGPTYYGIIKFMNDEDTLWLGGFRSLIHYSRQKGILQVLNNVDGRENSLMESIAYVPNFISLKNILKFQI